MFKMSYENAKLMKAAAYEANDLADKKLKSVPGISSGPMGLTPDHVRATPEYKQAKRDFDVTFARLREVNQWFMKNYKKEYAAERRAKREQQYKSAP